MTGPELAVLDVGQGDSIVMHDPESAEAVLFDCPAGRAEIPLAFLESRDLGRLRTLIVSHLHDDHYGGVLDVLRTIPADQVLVSLGIPAIDGHPKAVAFLREIKKFTVNGGGTWSIPRRSREPNRVPRFRHGAIQMAVLGPDERAELDAVAGSDANHASAIVRAQVGDFTVLLGADAPPARWAALVDSGDELSADVFICPHHGGAFGRSPKHLASLLARVSPQLVITSVGAMNAHKHPALSTMKTLRAYAASSGARIVCTQLNRHCAPSERNRGKCAGTVVVTWEDGRLGVRTERNDHTAWLGGAVADPFCFA